MRSARPLGQPIKGRPLAIVKDFLAFNQFTLSSCPSLEYKSSRISRASSVTSASRGTWPLHAVKPKRLRKYRYIKRGYNPQHGAAERIWVRPVRSSYATLVRSNNSESSTKYITNRMRTISYGSGRAQLPPALARSCDSLTSLNTVRYVGC